MKQFIYGSYQELSENTARQIAGIINENPDALLCFPAGETSLGTFEQLIRLNKFGAVSFKESRIVGLDEWLNLGQKIKENCYSFLKKHLFDHIDLSPENICFFDGESSNPEMECVKTDEFIKKNGPIEMILLGIGMNGHLGLNEPGVQFNLYSHVAPLDNVTKSVGLKYFSGPVDLSSGITLGISHILESKLVILQVSGARKAPVVKRLIESEITNDFPASVLKMHSNCYLLLDREASEKL